MKIWQIEIKRKKKGGTDWQTRNCTASLSSKWWQTCFINPDGEGKEVLVCVYKPPDRMKDFISEHKKPIYYYYSSFNIECYCCCRQFYCYPNEERLAILHITTTRTTMLCSLTFRINKLGCTMVPMVIIELAWPHSLARTHTQTRTK